MCILSGLLNSTFVLVSGFALFASKMLATNVFPRLAAYTKGVHPVCKNISALRLEVSHVYIIRVLEGTKVFATCTLKILAYTRMINIVHVCEIIDIVQAYIHDLASQASKRFFLLRKNEVLRYCCA